MMKRSDRSTNSGMAPSATPEERFAQRIRLLLDQSTNNLPQAALTRLAMARKAALRVQRSPFARTAPAMVLAGAGAGGGDSSRIGFARTGLVVSAVVLVAACLAGLYQVEQDRRIQELADVDSAVLSDDLPISAYADHGFNAYLKQDSAPQSP